MAEDVNPTPWWKPTLDARGRLMTSRRPVTGWRRVAEIVRNALIVAIVLGVVVEFVFGSYVIAGIFAWVVFLLVLTAQLRSGSQ